MMKSCVLLAVAGVSSGALGQSASLSIVASETVVDSSVTTSITLAVYGDSDWGTHMKGAYFELSATGGTGVVDDMALTSVASWGEFYEEDFGHAGDGNYSGVRMGQVVFEPFILPGDGSALGNGPVLLANFSVTIASGSSGVIDWSLARVPGTTWALEVYDEFGCPACTPPGVTKLFSAPDFGSISVNVVPSPSGLALLGFGGLVGGKRRR
tara:strand:+ start:30189 stop:30821 length:633 start_codon:yes stop_codon:yes gene_type:complete